MSSFPGETRVYIFMSMSMGGCRRDPPWYTSEEELLPIQSRSAVHVRDSNMPAKELEIKIRVSCMSRTVTWEAHRQRLHQPRLLRQDLRNQWSMGLEGEIVFAGPIPATLPARTHLYARPPIRSHKKGTHLPGAGCGMCNL
jgi:hypothetical protein